MIETPATRRSHLRSIMARRGRALPGAVTLPVVWHDLVEARSCMQCHALVMRDATRCDHCWAHLRQ